MINNLEDELADAVQYYWATRSGQGEAQRESEDSTRGRRAEVLGGQQMDGFAGLIEDIVVEATNLTRDAVRHGRYDAEVPGYYRAEKEWDTVIVHDNQLLAAIEYKSIASSFSNNMNNRAEEALGNNVDLLQAYEEGLFEPSSAPWLGYLMLMADNDDSRHSPEPKESNFPVDDEFATASYVDRMELLCLRMVRQRLVNNSAFVLSDEEQGLEGEYWEPNEELRFRRFVQSLIAHIEGQVSEYQDTLGSDTE